MVAFETVLTAAPPEPARTEATPTPPVTAAKAVPPAPPEPPLLFRVERTSAGTAVADLDGEGIDASDPSLDELRVIDERGGRTAVRLRTYRSCAKLCGEEDDDQVCHDVGDYTVQGDLPARYALAVPVGAGHLAPLSTATRALTDNADKAKRVAVIFANGFESLEKGGYAAGWMRDKTSGQWVLQQRWEGTVRSLNATLDQCAVEVTGELTEFGCGAQRWLFAGSQYIGALDDPQVGRMLRFAFEFGGTTYFVVVMTGNSVDFSGLLYHTSTGWQYRSLAPRYPTIC
jgi:hypothetical protein